MQNFQLGTCTSHTCELGVRIGFITETNSARLTRLPLRLLQHLAKLVIQFDPLIAMLNPLHQKRSNGAKHLHCGNSSSNTLFRDDRHACLLPYNSLKNIQSRIFLPS